MNRIESDYRRWWVGQKCRLNFSTGLYRRVADLTISGPPSLMTCVVTLLYDDGTAEIVKTPAQRPRKSDVDVLIVEPSRRR